MSSGFVSGGTSEKPIERDSEWLEAQEELEATRRRKEEESRQEGGKTLYEVLQANKAAKQEAFEDSIRLKNQFRNLDEDEVEFLDSVLESTRAREEAVKKETAEQLGLFRRQQEEADKVLLSEGGDTNDTVDLGKAGNPPVAESQWAINARKRKRPKDEDGLPKGLKLRKPPMGNTSPVLWDKHTDALSPTTISKRKNAESDVPVGKIATPIKALSTSRSDSKFAPEPSVNESETGNTGRGASTGLGLAGYSSDED